MLKELVFLLLTVRSPFQHFKDKLPTAMTTRDQCQIGHLGRTNSCLDFIRDDSFEHQHI